MTLRQKKNRQAVLIRKAAIATTLSVCLMQQVAGAEGYGVNEKTVKTDTISVSASSNTQAIQATTDKSVKKNPVNTKDQAVAKIREFFPQFKDAEVQSVTLGNPNVYPPRDEMVWTIQWEYQVGNNGYGFGSRVDALTGEILQVDFSPWTDLSRDKVKYPPTYTREQAEELVNKLVQRVAPNVDMQKLKGQDSTYYDYGTSLFGPTRYSFAYNIPVNGLPSEEAIYVSIDGEGNIFSYSRSKSELSYPSATPSITAEKAKSLYTESLKMELVYMPVGELYGPSKEMMLAYQPTNVQYGILDAKSGKFVDVTTGKEANMKPNTYQSITPTAKLFAAYQGSELTDEQAKEIALNVMKPPAANTRTNQHIQNDWYDPKVKMWYLSWDNPAGSGPNGGYDNQFVARIHAATGQILSIGNPYRPYRNENMTEKKNPEISLADAEKKANYWINLLYPDAATNLKLSTPSKEQNVQDNGGFHFEYQQFVGGIPVNVNSVRMELSSRGELVNYETSIQPLNLEGMKGLKPSMTAEEARSTYLDHLEMELRYSRVGPYDYSNANPNIKSEQRLVYSPKFNPENETVLNAITGKFEAGWYNARNNQDALNAQDIQGTTSEAAFKKLLKAGVLKSDVDGLVKPNDKIKLGDWMQWIRNAVRPYESNRDDKPLFKDITSDSTYYSAVSFFISKGWLKGNPSEFLRPETELTREQLAESVSRILQYEQLAKYLSKDLEVTQLQDAAEVQNKGVVALMLKLGIMSTDGGKFYPKSTVTRAEAAETIMKLVEIQGRIDSEIQR
ncbi:S-layer homology domain-containing protein [Paenibacillus terrigena]|uniref:S-layer homology domain-containing protein n=1 Tax=Paenibacillus terrigena TaxID=369333 RepID=UPI0028D71E8D|nr:S-layer homology domain-containing protein [Paenibacillus terrigena]